MRREPSGTLGENRRWKRLKQNDPMQKEIRETPDLTHLLDSFGAARPRPMWTVFPTDEE